MGYFPCRAFETQGYRESRSTKQPQRLKYFIGLFTPWLSLYVMLTRQLNLLRNYIGVVVFIISFSADVFGQGTSLPIWNNGAESVSLVIFNSPVACKRKIAVAISFPYGLHNSNEWVVWTVNYKDCNQNLRFVECATPIGTRCSRSNEFLSIIQSGASSILEGEHTVIEPRCEFNNMDIIIDVTNPRILKSDAPPKLLEGSACTAPTNVTARIENLNEAVITWPKGSSNSKYRVDYRKAHSYAWIMSKELTSNTYRITNLDYKTDYECTVTLLCPGGGEHESDFVEFKTLRPACKVPTIAIKKASNDTVQLSWTDTKSKQYILQHRIAGNSWNEMKLGSNSTQLTNLNFATTYEYRVAATDAYGTCDYSQIITHRTISNPCGNPSNLLSGDITSNSVALTWSSTTKPTEYLVEYSYDGQRKNQSTKDGRLVLTGLPYNASVRIAVYNRCLGGEKSDSPAQRQDYTLPEKATITLCSDFQYVDLLRVYVNNMPLQLTASAANPNQRCVERTLDLYERNNTIAVEYQGKRYTSQIVEFIPGVNYPITLTIPQEIKNDFEYRRREVTGNFNPFIPFAISFGASNLIAHSDIENFQSSVSLTAQRGRFCVDALLRGLENVTTGSSKLSQPTFQPHYLLDGSLGYHFSKFNFETQRETDQPGVFIKPERVAAAGLHVGAMKWYNGEGYQAKFIDTQLSSNLNVNGQTQINAYGGIHFRGVSHYSMKYRRVERRKEWKESYEWREWTVSFDYLQTISHVNTYVDSKSSSFTTAKINAQEISAGYRCSAKWSSNLAGSRAIFSVQGSFMNLPSMYALREIAGFKNNNLFYNLTFGFGWAGIKH